MEKLSSDRQKALWEISQAPNSEMTWEEAERKWSGIMSSADIQQMVNEGILIAQYKDGRVPDLRKTLKVFGKDKLYLRCATETNTFIKELRETKRRADIAFCRSNASFIISCIALFVSIIALFKTT